MTLNISLKDQVILKIKKDIQVNNIIPNQIITENQICSEMSISRTPVREALMLLTSDGILKRIPRKGYIVQEIDKKTKMDTFLIFGMLESMAAVLAIDYLTDEDLMKMREYIDRIEIALKYRNCNDYYRLNDEFHNIYIGKCNNEPLQKMIKDLESGPINRSYIGPCEDRLIGAFTECNNNHINLVHMFEEKDIEGIKAFHETHWATKYTDMI